MRTSSISVTRTGHYARKQLFSKSWLIAWSHGARFRMGVELVREVGGQSLLDYGCGDGTFLELLMVEQDAPHTAVGADIEAGQIVDCRNRLVDPRLSFVTIDELSVAHLHQAFDTLICMEVLEHVIDPEPLLNSWKRLVRPGGTIIVSVPIEIGAAFVVKQVGRRIAGWRGIGDYPGVAPYTWTESIKSVFAGDTQHFPRSPHQSANGSQWYCHKGFNWRVLQSLLKQHFKLLRTISTPWPLLPAGLGSQVWFVLKAEFP